MINLVLLALAALAAWNLRARWLEGREREAAALRAPVKPAPAPPMVPAPPVERVAAASYVDVAQKMLFSSDRSPEVEIVAPPPKPMPPLPVAYGVFALGDVPSAILSEKPGARHRSYAAGEMVGEFKLLSVSTTELVFEWEGKTITRTIEELAAKDRPPAEAAAAAAAPAQATVSTTTSVAAPVKPGPGIELTSEVRACQPGDNSPAGAVIDGMRKVVSRTPFGEMCRWERVK